MEQIKRRLQLITNPKQAQPGELFESLKILDDYAQQDDIHPRLKHFLEKRSYQKALVWMDGNEPEKGVCSK